MMYPAIWGMSKDCRIMSPIMRQENWRGKFYKRYSIVKYENQKVASMIQHTPMQGRAKCYACYKEGAKYDI